MSTTGHDPLDSVREGVDVLRRGTTLAAPPPPAPPGPAASTTAPERDTPPEEPATRTTDAPKTRRSASRARRSATPSSAKGDDLPGFARGARRQIGVGLTEATFDALRDARGSGRSNGDVVLDALRATHTELVATYAPGDAESDGLFPAQPRRRRRLDIEGVRRMEFMCSPAEAEVIGELAERCDLSLSALVEAALQLHLGGATSTS